MNDWLVGLGIKLPDLIAGLAGGVVNAIVFKRTTPLAYIGSVIVGAFTANYFGDIASQYLGTRAGAGAFLVGMGGMVICQSVVGAIPAFFARWSQTAGDRNA